MRCGAFEAARANPSSLHPILSSALILARRNRIACLQIEGEQAILHLAQHGCVVLIVDQIMQFMRVVLQIIQFVVFIKALHVLVVARAARL